MNKTVAFTLLCVLVFGVPAARGAGPVPTAISFDYATKQWTLLRDLRADRPIRAEVKGCANMCVTFKFDDVDRYPNSATRQALGIAATQTPGIAPLLVLPATVIPYPSQPYTPSKDALRVHVEITTQQAKVAVLETYEAVFPVYGRWVYDVSAGVIATGLIDPKFASKDVTVDGQTTTQLAPQETQDAFNVLYPTTLVHFFKTSPSDATWAATLGITPGDLQKFFVGPSLMLGQGNHWVFSGGFAFGRVERLNDDLSTTQRVWRSSWWGGISYKLLE